MMDEIQKLKYHIRLLAESIDQRENPIAALVVENDWSDEDLDAAHDIFEKFDHKLNDREKFSWVELETDFRNRFGMDYQHLKSVVLAFFRNSQWTLVCKEYADANPCLEFSEINADRSYTSSLLESDIESILNRHKIQYDKNQRIDAGDGRLAEFDFVIQSRGKRILIEAKRTYNVSAIERVENLTQLAFSRGLATESWLVLQQLPEDQASLKHLDGKSFVAVSISDLEERLQH